MGEFLKGSGRDDKEIVEALLRLRGMQVPEFSKEYTLGVPKMIWKIACTYQCLIRRTVEAADGSRMGWNAGNLLTCLTMARSVMETAGVVRFLTDSIKEAVPKKDTKGIDDAVMNLSFAARHEHFADFDGAVKAKSVLTYIDKMDVSVFGDKEGRIRDAYDFLCEFVHPNHLGLLGLYERSYPEEYRIEFGAKREGRWISFPILGLRSE